jgi:hypothetical protein
MPYAIHNTLPSICDSDSADCAVCVLAHQAAVADNVSRKNGREPALDVLRAQLPSHTGKRF